MAVVVVGLGGAGALDGPVRWAGRDAVLGLRGVEIALRDSATGELVHNARRIATAVDQLVASGDLDDEVPVYVELPRLYDARPTPDWLAALDEVAAPDHRLKLRTGGPDGRRVPERRPSSPRASARPWTARLAFKCTAGLHHAVRHGDPTTGLTHHGFLNVLLATRASLDGASVGRRGRRTRGDRRRGLLAGGDETGLAGARRWFTVVRLVQRRRAARTTSHALGLVQPWRR